MALKFIDRNNFPTYLAVSTDVSDSKISGASLIGKTVFLTDTGAWKIIDQDETLVDFYFPNTTPVA